MIGQGHEPGASNFCARDIRRIAIGSNQVVSKPLGSLCRKHALVDEE